MDIGQGLPFNIPRHHYFLTHCHSDHAGGLAYVLSQRSLWSLPPANVYMLPEYVKPLTDIVNIWHKLEDFTYPVNMHGMNIGDSVQIEKDFEVSSFRTVHRVPSQGYMVSRKKKKLKLDYRKLPQEELMKRIKAGDDVNEIQTENIFAFTGDTQIEFLDTFKTPVDVLFMETTFIDELRSVDAARKWGHIHIDEWKQKIADLPAKKIVLIHLSSRYGTKRALEVLEKEIDKEFRGKVELFPRPF